MTNRENYLSIIKRTGYEMIPVDFNLCPFLEQKMKEYDAEHGIMLDQHIKRRDIPEFFSKPGDPHCFDKYYDVKFKPGTHVDQWGIAHEPGSKEAMHMTRMHHPMKHFDSVEQILEYPFPVLSRGSYELQKAAVSDVISNDCIAIGNMQMTVWETAWYLRGMENLMADMMMEDPIAETLLDKITELAVMRASSFAKAGCDILFLGDDIGMQHSIMMSESLYCDWLKPRLKKIIAAAKQIKPDIIIFYHSCGLITPFIPHLIEAGIDVLNPVQPECMDFEEIHAQYGDKLSFHGTIGTQTTMPFGTPQEVRQQVFRNLDIAGEKGGLLVAPTHLLEPEVPIENVIAYIKACRDYIG